MVKIKQLSHTTTIPIPLIPFSIAAVVLTSIYSVLLILAAGYSAPVMTEKGTLHLNKQLKLRQIYIDRYLR